MTYAVTAYEVPTPDEGVEYHVIVPAIGRTVQAPAKAAVEDAAVALIEQYTGDKDQPVRVTYGFPG